MTVMMVSSALVVVVLMAVVGTGQSNLAPRRYCGPSLSSMLDMVCEGIFYKKRATQDIEKPQSAEYWDQSGPGVGSLFTDRSEAVSLLRRRSYRSPQRSVGIVDECCYKACSIQEMSTYCGTATPTTTQIPPQPEY